MGVHESQSLLWERMVFQSQEFTEFVGPVMKKHFPHMQDITTDELYTFINRVKPDCIRVDADEVTYPMHIILRFELEQALFDKSVSVQNLPTIWNDKMKESLNVDVPNDAKGVLQDIHWYLYVYIRL
jgi:carboxypeptidase Taq